MTDVKTKSSNNWMTDDGQLEETELSTNSLREFVVFWNEQLDDRCENEVKQLDDRCENEVKQLDDRCEDEVKQQLDDR